MKKRLLSILFFVGLMTGCSDTIISSKTQTIIGNNDSESTSEFIQFVGHFEYRDKENLFLCNGYISGEHEISSVDHCFEKLIVEELQNIFFITGIGETIPITSIISRNTHFDKITFGVEKAMSFPLAGKFDPNFPVTIINVSMHGDVRKAGTGKVEKYFGSFISYKIDTDAGSSGSPILQGNMIVGMHIGTFSDRTANIGVLIVEHEIQLLDISFEWIAECHSLNPFCKNGAIRSGLRKVDPSAKIKQAKKAFEELVLGTMVKAVASNEELRKTAVRNGWTQANCLLVGSPVIGLTIGIYTTPICAMLGLTGGPGTGQATVTPVCVATVVTLSSAITTGVCVSFCHSKTLLDCKD